MSLIKKSRTTKHLEALARNRKHSHGPATAAGRRRIRDANLRHGFYAKGDDAALLCALGDDPADLEALEQGLSNPETAIAALQERLGKDLAKAVVNMERAVRMRDGIALRQAQEEEHARQGRLHMQMMRLKITARHWQWLAQQVTDPHYVTTREDLNYMRQLHKEGAAKEMSEVTLTLFYQLREPGSLMPGDPGFEDEEKKDQYRAVLINFREMFGLGPEPLGQANDTVRGYAGEESSIAATAAGDDCPENPAAANQEEMKPPDPYPDITPEQWAEREPLRQLLQNLLTRQVESFEAQHRDLLRASLTGPTSYERAAVTAPTHPHSQLMQRMEDAQSRRVARLTSLMIRLQRHEARKENRNKRGESEYVEDNKRS